MLKFYIRIELIIRKTIINQNLWWYRKMKYVIEIEQTEGVMSDEFTKRYYELEHITEILLGCYCSTSIGVYPDSVACRLICVKPSSLFIPIYCSINNQDYEKVIEKLNSITNEEILKVEVKLSLKELAHENYQIIKITKNERSVRQKGEIGY